MSSTVWGNHLESAPAEENIQFCAGRDVQSIPQADEALLNYDLWTNRAHSCMLYEQGILPQETAKKIMQGLNELEALVHAGKFVLDPQKEDVHINVEAFVTERYGASVGGMMHTGRSRNDQAACDMRLYLREACLQASEQITDLTQALISHARPQASSLMPGFTHYQPGMITSWGHWVASYIQALLRDLERFTHTFELINRNPLGAAASFGTSWPLDRNRTAELLGFSKVDVNTLDCITARWENETQLAQSYAMHMNHLSVMSQDLIVLSLPYIQMLQVDEAFVTGSSIMPQKKNPDFAEVIKSKASLVHGAITTLLGIQKGGLSGYNRDTQLTKYLIMDVIRECEAAPRVMKHVFDSLQVNQKQMRALCNQGFMNAVDLADSVAKQYGLSFREGYHLAAAAVRHATHAKQSQLTTDAIQAAFAELHPEIKVSPESLETLQSPEALVQQRTHLGAPSEKSVQEQLDLFEEEVQIHKDWNQQQHRHLDDAKKLTTQACLSI